MWKIVRRVGFVILTCFAYMGIIRWTMDHAEGFGFAMGATPMLLLLYWPFEPNGVGHTSIHEYEYKKLRSKSNPLYLHGYFRKGPEDEKKGLILAGPKGLYWTELHAILQIVVLWSYGIASLVKGCNFKVQYYLIIWIVIGLGVRIIVEIYYWYTLKSFLKKKSPLEENFWKPFTMFTLDAEKPAYFPWENGKFDEMEHNFSKECEKMGYVLWEKIQLKKIRLYVRNRGIRVDIFIVAHIQETEKNLLQMNEMLKEFFKKYFGTKQPKRKICLTYFIFMDETVCVHTFCKLKQKLGRYYLPVYYSLERGGFYIPKQKSGFGLKQYKKMYSECRRMLDQIIR